MARTILFSASLSALVAWNWARLEAPRPGLAELALVAALGVLPALLPRRRLRVAAGSIAFLVAARVALGVSPLDARPFDGKHDFVGPLLDRVATGFLDFYDVLVPFEGSVHARMHGVLLLAVFAFSLLGALAVAARRPLAAALALIAGAGWPATILPGGDDLERGALLLAFSLALVAWLRPGSGRRPARLAAGTALVALALVASSSSAVAKGQFVNWQDWDLYNKPDKPVTVEYVWRSNYRGIHFPTKRTQVLTVHAPGRSAYWRATTLDAFHGDNWDEDLLAVFPTTIRGAVTRDDLSADVLLPRTARDPSNWTRADVTVRALRDFHLVGASVPVAYDVRDIQGVQYASGGVALVPVPPSRGSEYTVWGYAPRPTPAELGRSLPDYPYQIAVRGRYLTVDRARAVPPFGMPGRAKWFADYFDSYPGADRYLPLYRVARRIAGSARNPYAATVALEAWFRSGGGFTYDATPPTPARGVPPLVDFVTRTKRGYCQHFAGAMALMLRYLGIPARVAAGFTSGNYDLKRRSWRVYDRNAHTWVEVWFRGYGWLPFDPTPSRGNLGGPYTASSLSFDAPGAVKVLAASAIAGQRLLRYELRSRGRPGRGDPVAGVPGDPRHIGGGRSRGGEVGLAGILVLAALLFALLLAVGKLVLRRSRYLTRDPRRIASACRRELVEFLEDQRIEVPRSTPLGELRDLVKTKTGVESRRFVEALGLARFGPAGSAGEAARLARQELRTVRRRLRRALPPVDRLRGLFSPRSLLARR